MKSILLLFLVLIPISRSYSYPHFIGHGYPSCLNCHFNPLGNGPLTDYGRAVGADAISSGFFYPKKWDEEKIASLSGFLFRTPKQDHVRTQLNYRGMELDAGPGTSTEQKTWIHMQAGGQLILKFLTDDRLTFVGELGYSPPSQHPVPGVEDKKLRTREYYVGYRILPQIGVYAGFLDKAYGIRIAEHISYSRVVPQITQNDQTHGIMTHFIAGEWEGAVHGFVGNLSQTKDIRQKGFSTVIEHNFFENHRIGFSFLKSKNDYLNITSYAAHSRFNLQDGSALLFELGQTKKQTLNGNGDQLSRYLLLQTYLRPERGLYLIANIEYLKSDLSSESSTVRWGPGIQLFPIQKLELRLDAYDSRNFNPNQSTNDSWMLLFQTHLWL